MIYLIAACLTLVVATFLLIRRRPRGVTRSPREVADILRQFAAGEPTGFLADTFIHIPITDPALDSIRERFEQLADRHMEWQPQAPFPERGRRALDTLIAETDALANGAAGRIL